MIFLLIVIAALLFFILLFLLIGTVLFAEPLTGRMAAGIAICVAAVIFMILKPGKQAG